MKSFSDAAGRAWEVTIHVAACKRVRGLTGVDLYGLVDDGGKPLEALMGDIVKFVDVLYALCQPQAEGRGLTDEDFGASLGGDSLEHAADAFAAELLDFFPRAKVRGALKRVMSLAREAADLKAGEMAERADRLRLEDFLPRPNGSSGARPESSASTPGA
jgi:hypothetical protein